MTQENTRREAPVSKRDFQIYKRVPVDSLKTFPQTRGITFEDLEIRDLETSIRKNGIHQPLLVCHIQGEEESYAVICGHRRLKAALACRLQQVPVLVRKDVVHGRAESRQIIETIQIEENLQRQDLTAFQEALVIGDYKKRYGLNNTQLAQKLGIPRSTVQDTLRIAGLMKIMRGADRSALASQTDPKGGADRSAPPPAPPEPWPRLHGFSRLTLLVLANCRRESFFPKVMKKCLEGGVQGKALKHYVRLLKNRRKPQRSPMSKPKSRSAAFYRGCLRLDVKIRVDESLDERVREIEPSALQKDLDGFLDFLTDLGREALRMVFPAPPFSLRMGFLAGTSSQENERKARVETVEQINQFLSRWSAAPLAEDEHGGPTELERARFNQKRPRALTPLERDVCGALDLMLRSFDGGRFSPEVMGRFLAAGLKTEEVIEEFNRLPHRPETSPSDALVTHLLRRILGRCIAPDEDYRNPIYFSKPKFAGDAEERLLPRLSLADYEEKYLLRSLNLKPRSNQGTPWETILNRLREKMSAEDFKRCYAGSRFCREDGERLYIFLPENRQLERIETEFHEVFVQCVPKEKEVYFITPDTLAWIGADPPFSH